MQFVFHKECADDLIDPFYCRWLFNRATWFAAERGDLVALRWLVEQCPGEVLTKAVTGAASGGHTNILEWLHKHHYERCCWGGVELCRALINKHSETVEWLKNYAPPRLESLSKVVQAAGTAGNVEVLTRLYFGCCAATEGALGSAQLGGQWETARWIIGNCELKEVKVNWSAAARGGELSSMQYAFSVTIEGLNKNALYAAAAGGRLDIVEWLHKSAGLELRSEAARRAAANGHLEIVQWFRENGCEGWDIGIIDAAATSDNVDAVKCLYENSSDTCQASTMNRAARNGCLLVVKWLHEEYGLKDCSVFAMDVAARSGHLQVVQYLHENRSEGCSSAAMNWAARSGHLDIVKWLHYNRPEICTAQAMNWAARNGHLETVKWLHANRNEGCTESAIDEAAANGHFAVVKWLHHNSSKGFTRDAVTKAVVNGHIQVVLFLHELRPEGFSFEVDVITNPNLELAQWLITNYPDEINGCALVVPNWDWHFNAWCRKINLQCFPGENASKWVCDSASLRLPDTMYTSRTSTTANTDN